MSQIDSVGTYTGEIVEAGVTVTKKSGYPQLVLRIKADKKFIDTPGDMKHFGIEAPAYVDWSTFLEDTVAYLVLFKDTENFSKETALLNYEQVQIATGWDGQSFESLADGSLIGKKILFRVEENTFEDNTRLQVSWIDAYESSPQRQLKSLDAAAIKALPKINIGKAAKPVAPAKPVAAKPAPAGATKPSPTSAAGATKPTTPAPAATAPVAAAPASTPAPAAAAPAAPPKTPKAPKAPKAAPPPPAAEKSVAAAGAPVECTQLEGWEYVCAHKGDNDDATVQDAWIAACKEVGGERDEETFTPAEWAKIRDIVLKDLAV